MACEVTHRSRPNIPCVSHVTRTNWKVKRRGLVNDSLPFKNSHVTRTLTLSTIYPIFWSELWLKRKVDDDGSGTPFQQARENKKTSPGTWSHSATSRVELGNSSVRLCHYGRRAILCTSKTQRYPGKAFYTCSLSKVNWEFGIGVMWFKFKFIVHHFVEILFLILCFTHGP